MANKYNVAYTGKILSGFDEALVQPQVAQLLKLPPEKVNTFFSGQKITIKKNIDLESALKIQSALNAKGLTIQITEDRSNPPPIMVATEVADKPMFELVRDEPVSVPEVKPTMPSSFQQQRVSPMASGTVMPLAQTRPTGGHQQRALASTAGGGMKKMTTMMINPPWLWFPHF